jgi:hypothetical protein
MMTLNNFLSDLNYMRLFLEYKKFKQIKDFFTKIIKYGKLSALIWVSY